MRALLSGLGIGVAFFIGWLLLQSSGGPLRERPTISALDTITAPAAAPALQHIRSLDLEGSYSFAGQDLPVENFDVRERLDLELMRNAYFHRNTLLMLKRRARYFPVIDSILREEGVPTDLKYLAAAESSLANARSPAGARGVWQFMAPTARSYGLTVNGEVDERLHLEKATRAAAQYLKDYHRQFDGDWHLVAAAYNMGGPNLRKWMKRQRAAELFDLDINSETMQYLFRIVALKTILENPEDFGYHVSPTDHYPALDNYRTVRVTEAIPNLGDFAHEQGTTYRMLKLYNPWLVTGRLSRSGGYDIRIPVERNY